MRKKGLMVLGLVMGMSLSMSLLSYAGEWKNDNIGWWWQNDNGTYPVNKWEWLDGNKDGIAECYYFNESGYCLMATTTSDNYTVNESGAWIVNGVVQTKSVNESESTSQNSNSTPSNNGAAYSDDKYDYYNVNGQTIAVPKNEEIKIDGSLKLNLEKYKEISGLTDEQCQPLLDSIERCKKALGLTDEQCQMILDKAAEDWVWDPTPGLGFN